MQNILYEIQRDCWMHERDLDAPNACSETGRWQRHIHGLVYCLFGFD